MRHINAWVGQRSGTDIWVNIPGGNQHYISLSNCFQIEVVHVQYNFVL